MPLHRVTNAGFFIHGELRNPPEPGSRNPNPCGEIVLTEPAPLILGSQPAATGRIRGLRSDVHIVDEAAQWPIEYLGEFVTDDPDGERVHVHLGDHFHGGDVMEAKPKKPEPTYPSRFDRDLDI